jgi:23S rRNA (adenine2503-C2)-methyltransferase
MVASQNNFNHSIASVIFNWHYKKKETTHCHGKISKYSSAFFEQQFDFSLPEIDTFYESKKKIDQ